MPHPRCLSISTSYKEQLRFLFLAKHALGDGSMDPEDGNHAVYHHELRRTLERLGLRITAAATFTAVYDRPAYDFLISLYNRAGFRNSEMFAPLLAQYCGIPCLGGSPMVRGLSDDKHFMKRIAQSVGIRTAPWR